MQLNELSRTKRLKYLYYQATYTCNKDESFSGHSVQPTLIIALTSRQAAGKHA